MKINFGRIFLLIQHNRGSFYYIKQLMQGGGAPQTLILKQIGQG
jgi:hypothetical protein